MSERIEQNPVELGQDEFFVPRSENLTSIILFVRDASDQGLGLIQKEKTPAGAVWRNIDPLTQQTRAALEYCGCILADEPSTVTQEKAA